MTKEELKRMEGLMQCEQVNYAGAQALSEDELEAHQLRVAHAAVNICRDYYTSERTISIKPKRWWQLWK